MQVREMLKKSFNKGTYKCVVSGPSNKSQQFRKINLNLVGGIYHVEKLSATQAFHEKMDYEEAFSYIAGMLENNEYKNLNAWDTDNEYSIKLNKRGEPHLSAKSGAGGMPPKIKESHDREKNYILKQGTYIPPLVDMGIFTKDGRVISSMYDKYRQINRFIEIVDDEVKKTDKSELNILDFGCGKSYLTFVLYHYFTEIKGIKVNMTGLDLKEDVVKKCALAARKYGYENLCFKTGDIGAYRSDKKIDIVVSLHACDTATDYAIFNAIRFGAEMMFIVPCCQHEINAQLNGGENKFFTRHGIIKERYAALITDTLRANLLNRCGYKTDMLEFISFEHTPKNIMIRAVKSKGKRGDAELREAEAVINELRLTPTLYGLLRDAGLI